MELAYIPFDDLKVSPLNMRHGRKAPPLDDLLPSIRARGVLKPLLVRKAGRAYEIAAGRRRYFALKTLAKEGATPGDYVSFTFSGKSLRLVDAPQTKLV